MTRDLSTTIGIIGGGQLARMSTQAAQSLGYKVVILDADSNSPAAQVTPWRVPLEWSSTTGTAELADKVSVITLENEWVSPLSLQKAQSLGCKVYPSGKTLEIVGDKLAQRERFAAHDLPSPRFTDLQSWSDAQQTALIWGLPLVLKSRRGGYDGYGVVIIRTEADWAKVEKLDARLWYAEEHVSFDKELAVMVARRPSGEATIYPVVESRQTSDGHRCDLVIAPAPTIDAATAEHARNIAFQAVEAVEGIGLFGIELFAADDRLIINEIAPRPHNSGHYTMDGSKTSQFEQHIRAINDLPLGPTELLAPVVVMANLLAPSDGKVHLASSLAAALAVCPDVHIHWYGKDEMRSGRKMGHINVLGTDVNKTIANAIAAREAFWKNFL